MDVNSSGDIEDERQKLQHDIQRIQDTLYDDSYSEYDSNSDYECLEIDLEPPERIPSTTDDADDTRTRSSIGASSASQFASTEVSGGIDFQQDQELFGDEESVTELPVTTETTLALNRAYQEVLVDLLQQIEEGLVENRQKQENFEKDFVGQRERAVLSNPFKLFQRQYSMPFIKDPMGGVPPPNEDVVMKKQMKEHKQDLHPNRDWLTRDRKKMSDAVAEDALQQLLQPLMMKLELEQEKLESCSKVEEIEVISRRIDTIEEEITEKRGTSRQDLLNNVDCTKVDWMKISNIAFEGRKTFEECQMMWLNVLNPGVNRGKWDAAEDAHLLELVKRTREKDWMTVATLLNTGRTPYMCLKRYQTQLNLANTSRPWTDEEDKKLLEIVHNLRSSGHRLIWSKVSGYLDNRSGVMCYQRFHQIDPNMRRGPWTKEEDMCLFTAVKLVGTARWTRLPDFVPGRSTMQCRDRWLNCLDPRLRIGNWTYEEDKELLKAAQEMSTKSWKKIAEKLPGRSENMVLQRYRRLESFRMKSEWFQKLPESTRRGLLGFYLSKDELKKKEALTWNNFKKELCVYQDDYHKQERDRERGDLVVPRPPPMFGYTTNCRKAVIESRINLQNMIMKHMEFIEKSNNLSTEVAHMDPRTEEELAGKLQTASLNSISVRKLIQISRDVKSGLRTLEPPKMLRPPKKVKYNFPAKKKRQRQEEQLRQATLAVFRIKRRLKKGRPRKFFSQSTDTVEEDKHNIKVKSLNLVMKALDIDVQKMLTNASDVRHRNTTPPSTSTKVPSTSTSRKACYRSSKSKTGKDGKNLTGKEAVADFDILRSVSEREAQKSEGVAVDDEPEQTAMEAHLERLDGGSGNGEQAKEDKEQAKGETIKKISELIKKKQVTIREASSTRSDAAERRGDLTSPRKKSVTFTSQSSRPGAGGIYVSSCSADAADSRGDQNSPRKKSVTSTSQSSKPGAGGPSTSASASALASASKSSSTASATASKSTPSSKPRMSSASTNTETIFSDSDKDEETNVKSLPLLPPNVTSMAAFKDLLLSRRKHVNNSGSLYNPLSYVPENFPSKQVIMNKTEVSRKRGRASNTMAAPPAKKISTEVRGQEKVIEIVANQSEPCITPERIKKSYKIVKCDRKTMQTISQGSPGVKVIKVMPVTQVKDSSQTNPNSPKMNIVPVQGQQKLPASNTQHQQQTMPAIKTIPGIKTILATSIPPSKTIQTVQGHQNIATTTLKPVQSQQSVPGTIIKSVQGHQNVAATTITPVKAQQKQRAKTLKTVQFQQEVPAKPSLAIQTQQKVPAKSSLAIQAQQKVPAKTLYTVQSQQNVSAVPSVSAQKAAQGKKTSTPSTSLVSLNMVENSPELRKIRETNEYKQLRARFHSIFMWPALMSTVQPAFDRSDFMEKAHTVGGREEVSSQKKTKTGKKIKGYVGFKNTWGKKPKRKVVKNTEETLNKDGSVRKKRGRHKGKCVILSPPVSTRCLRARPEKIVSPKVTKISVKYLRKSMIQSVNAMERGVSPTTATENFIEVSGSPEEATQTKDNSESIRQTKDNSENVQHTKDNSESVRISAFSIVTSNGGIYRSLEAQPQSSESSASLAGPFTRRSSLSPKSRTSMDNSMTSKGSLMDDGSDVLPDDQSNVDESFSLDLKIDSTDASEKETVSKHSVKTHKGSPTKYTVLRDLEVKGSPAKQRSSTTKSQRATKGLTSPSSSNPADSNSLTTSKNASRNRRASLPSASKIRNVAARSKSADASLDKSKDNIAADFEADDEAMVEAEDVSSQVQPSPAKVHKGPVEVKKSPAKVKQVPANVKPSPAKVTQIPAKVKKVISGAYKEALEAEKNKLRTKLKGLESSKMIENEQLKEKSASTSITSKEEVAKKIPRKRGRKSKDGGSVDEKKSQAKKMKSTTTKTGGTEDVSPIADANDSAAAAGTAVQSPTASVSSIISASTASTVATAASTASVSSILPESTASTVTTAASTASVSSIFPESTASTVTTAASTASVSSIIPESTASTVTTAASTASTTATPSTTASASAAVSNVCPTLPQTMPTSIADGDNPLLQTQELVGNTSLMPSQIAVGTNTQILPTQIPALGGSTMSGQQIPLLGGISLAGEPQLPTLGGNVLFGQSQVPLLGSNISQGQTQMSLPTGNTSVPQNPFLGAVPTLPLSTTGNPLAGGAVPMILTYVPGPDGLAHPVLQAVPLQVLQNLTPLPMSPNVQPNDGSGSKKAETDLKGNERVLNDNENVVKGNGSVLKDNETDDTDPKATPAKNISTDSGGNKDSKVNKKRAKKRK